jgi:hypothetical protein
MRLAKGLMFRVLKRVQIAKDKEKNHYRPGGYHLPGSIERSR